MVRMHIETRDGSPNETVINGKKTGEVYIQLLLTKERHDKLQALAAHQKKSIYECINGFIDTCVTNGGDWKHPGNG